MVSSFIREYCLKQQSPLIHFQYDQEGATLRATEVKPKLDRFIIAQMKKKGEQIPAEWYIDKDDNGKAALNYKLRIIANDNPLTTKEKVLARDRLRFSEKAEKRQSGELIHDFFFGNQGARDQQIAEYKESILFHQPLTLSISCFISDLLDAIDSYLSMFFAVTNFGTRQSKGFGGFSLFKNDNQSPSDEETIELIRSYGKPFFYCKIAPDFKPQRRRDIVLMNHAAAVYAIMKGGMNLTGYDPSNGQYRNPDAYIKGYIQRAYLDGIGEHSTGSDKAKIKHDVVKPLRDHDDRYKTEYSQFTFVRALLGLADHYEFRDDIRCRPSFNGSGFQVRKVHILNFKSDALNRPGRLSNHASIQEAFKEGIGIARFRSPITIKILSNAFVFIFEDTYKSILNKRFFLLNDHQKGDYDNGNDDQKIRVLCESAYILTPADFNVPSFIRSFIAYFDKEKNNLQYMQSTPHYRQAHHPNGSEFQLVIGGAEV